MSKQKLTMRHIQGIDYQLERKQVKNLNLRIRRDGSVYVSANSRVTLAQIDDFVCRHNTFIRQAQQRRAETLNQSPLPVYSVEDCQTIFSKLLTEIYPLVQPLGVAMPRLRVRQMVSRWGSCQTQKGIITLNTQLMAAPQACIEYVILHELCHFLQPNHSKHFYALLDQLMPDWLERKKQLNQTPLTAKED